MSDSEPRSRSHLEPAAEADGVSLAEHAVELVADHLETIGSTAVAPRLSGIDDIRAWLAGCDFENAHDPAAVLDEVAEQLSSSGVHTTHPRYFGLFNPTPTWAGVAGDIVTAGFNPQLAAHSHAPAAVELERHVLRFMSDRLGLPAEAHGSFTSGGAEANHTATVVALTARIRNFASAGVAGSAERPVFYASAESHLAWLKIAHACGLGRDAVRLVSVDLGHRLDLAALDSMYARDVSAGLKPFMIVGTAGTTGAGAIDPLHGLADRAERWGLHFHVDAAWAGAVVLSDSLRPLLSGAERADSVTIDAHKWMSVPMGAGMIFTAEPGQVAQAFHVETSYMPAQSAAGDDPYTSSMQWSRRAIGVKLFASLSTHGRQGYERQLEHDVALGEYIASQVASSGWTRINDTLLPVVCIADPEADRGPDSWRWHSAVAEHVVLGGDAWISPVRLSGRAAIRICVTSHRSTERDVDILLEALDRARRSVPRRS